MWENNFQNCIFVCMLSDDAYFKFEICDFSQSSAFTTLIDSTILLLSFLI